MPTHAVKTRDNPRKPGRLASMIYIYTLVHNWHGVRLALPIHDTLDLRGVVCVERKRKQFIQLLPAIQSLDIVNGQVLFHLWTGGRMEQGHIHRRWEVTYGLTPLQLLSVLLLVFELTEKE